jgi:hypothetical protein
VHLRREINTIQSCLSDARKQATDIRNNLKLNDLSITDKDFFLTINECLNDLHFDIVYTNKLKNFKTYGHLPSITIFKEQYQKTNGGRIYIYDKYSEEKKRELLMHEFIHIYDNFTPTWSTDDKDSINGYMLSKLTLNAVELKTDLISMELMMPIHQMQIDLFNCSYDINKIVHQYRAIKPSSVLRWLTIHDYFNAHFAILYFVENKSRQIEIIPIDEFSRDKSTQFIYNVIYNEKSIAYDSYTHTVPKSGESNIDNKDYQCFCFYEKNVQQPLPSNVNPLETIMTCDEMAIVGWPKDVYDYIKQLKFK